MFITGVNDTGDYLFTGVNNASEKLLPVMLLLAINGSPVSLTRAITPCPRISIDRQCKYVIIADETISTGKLTQIKSHCMSVLYCNRTAS
jgi:hypothetical protein